MFIGNHLTVNVVGDEYILYSCTEQCMNMIFNINSQTSELTIPFFIKSSFGQLSELILSEKIDHINFYVRNQAHTHISFIID